MRNAIYVKCCRFWTMYDTVGFNRFPRSSCVLLLIGGLDIIIYFCYMQQMLDSLHCTFISSYLFYHHDSLISCDTICHLAITHWPVSWSPSEVHWFQTFRYSCWCSYLLVSLNTLLHVFFYVYFYIYLSYHSCQFFFVYTTCMLFLYRRWCVPCTTTPASDLTSPCPLPRARRAAGVVRALLQDHGAAVPAADQEGRLPVLRAERDPSCAAADRRGGNGY